LPLAFCQDRVSDTGSRSRIDVVHFNRAVYPDWVDRLHRLRTTRALETDSGRQEESFMMTYRQVYVRTVLNLYIQIQDTPSRPTLRDHVVADRFFDRTSQLTEDVVFRFRPRLNIARVLVLVRQSLIQQPTLGLDQGKARDFFGNLVPKFLYQADFFIGR